MTGPDFILLRPYWMLAVPVIAGLAWWVLSRARGFGTWDKVADAALMQDFFGEDVAIMYAIHSEKGVESRARQRKVDTRQFGECAGDRVQPGSITLN